MQTISTQLTAALYMLAVIIIELAIIVVEIK